MKHLAITAIFLGVAGVFWSLTLVSQTKQITRLSHRVDVLLSSVDVMQQVVLHLQDRDLAGLRSNDPNAVLAVLHDNTKPIEWAPLNTKETK